jgi:hypothetical protein
VRGKIRPPGDLEGQPGELRFAERIFLPAPSRQLEERGGDRPGVLFRDKEHRAPELAERRFFELYEDLKGEVTADGKVSDAFCHRGFYIGRIAALRHLSPPVACGNPGVGSSAVL